MLKLSEQQKQYSKVQGRLPNVLKVRHIPLAETDFTSLSTKQLDSGSETLLPYLQQTATIN